MSCICLNTYRQYALCKRLLTTAGQLIFNKLDFTVTTASASPIGTHPIGTLDHNTAEKLYLPWVKQHLNHVSSLA